MSSRLYGEFAQHSYAGENVVLSIIIITQSAFLFRFIIPKRSDTCQYRSATVEHGISPMGKPTVRCKGD